jgi:preprotein translocase subunit SecD
VKNTRSLWLSIAFVLVLVSLSIIGLVSGALTPRLGLDLEGGVAVILSAPDGTPTDVMEQTLANIRDRVDTFGVGEPDIFLSGTTIEVQIPGLSQSTVETRAADLSCLVGEEDANFGCAEDEQLAEDTLAELEVTSSPSRICLIGGDGTRLECFGTQEEVANARLLYTVDPKASSTPSASASASATPSATPSTGPALPADEYCITNGAQDELACYDTEAEATEVLDGTESKITEREWNVTPTVPEPEPTPTPTPSADPSATESPTPTPTPSSSPSPSGQDLYGQLDLNGAEPLPNGLETKGEAEDALAAIEVRDVTERYCVVSSQGEDLGCYLTQDAAAKRQRETGQERLLNVIGTTARLEERQTLEVILPTDPRYPTTPLTCFTEAELRSAECEPGALDDEEVVYLDSQENKVRLGPVIITGANLDQATAVLIGGQGTQQAIPEWVVQFELDDEGSEAFGAATTAAVSAPPPQNQIAIAVDRTIISNPVVNEPITGGSGVISGGFTEQGAKDLATVLSAGALPVELTQEAVRTVSPTLGEESLRQGIVAGIAGLVLLFLYLLLYYRLLGIVAWLGMSIWAILAVALVSLAGGEEIGYALTLAGVAGLVISLGVTADSYIVFFERLKDEMRGGKSARTVVQPAFKRAFRTIIAADVVTGLAAIVLYLTAVSSVRGFALTLGVATLLDVFVVYFFKRPTVFLLARNAKIVNLRGFGLSAATAADHVALDTSGEVEPS